MRVWIKKHFPAIDRFVDRTGYWGAFFFAGWLAMSWIANSISGLAQFGWGAVVFAGLAVACLAVLSLTGSLALYRYFSPLPPAVPPVGASAVPKGIQLDALVDDVWEKFSDVNRTMVNLFKHSDETLAKVADDLRGQIKASNERIEATTKSHRYELSLLADRVFALKTTYELRRLHRDIERLSALLEKPLKQPKEERDWSAWPVRFRNFLRATTKFSHLAGVYYPDEASNLTRVDPSIYRISDGDFALENFPDLQMAHDFKTFRQRRVSYEGLGEGMLERIESKT
jgi:hypothetical protein